MKQPCHELPYHFLSSIYHKTMFYADTGLRKTEPVEQYVFPETYVPVVLKLIHDIPTAGHPGRDRTLAAARRVHYWPTMHADIDRYVAQCLIACAKLKGITKKTSTHGTIPTIRVSVGRCFNRLITNIC